MQLKIQRSQRMGGVTGATVLFCLDARAEYSLAEAADIGKYRLGKEIVYSSRAAQKHRDNASLHLDRTQEGRTRDRAAGLARGLTSIALAALQLNITVSSLGRGHHIECKDLAELMEAEEAVMAACKNVRDYLALAATFNGSITLINFEEGEQQHVSHGLLQLEGPQASETMKAEPSSESSGQSLWQELPADLRKYAPVGIELVIAILALFIFSPIWVFLIGMIVMVATAARITAKQP